MLSTLKKNLFKYRHIKEVPEMLDSIKIHSRVIHKILDHKLKLVHEMSNDKELINFFERTETIPDILEFPDSDKMISKLQNFKERDGHIYLSWMALHFSNDTIDNNGRSRQKEYKDDSKEYNLSNRNWYQEIINSKIQPVITHPVKDTSGSYVIAIGQRYGDDSKCYGAIGVDVSIRALAQSTFSKYRYLIAFDNGNIIYDSKYNLANILNKRNNIIMIYPKELVQDIFKGKTGSCLVQKNRFYQLVVYCPIHETRYYLIYIIE